MGTDTASEPPEDVIGAPTDALRWTDEHDPENPFNWPATRRWSVVCLACYVTFIVGWNATTVSGAAIEIGEYFGVSDQSFPNSFWPVTSWTTGAAVAPMIVLPIMEDFGVRPGYLISYFIFSIFVIPQAVAKNFATLVATRFFAGCCAGILQDGTDGIVADLFPDPVKRSLPISCYVFSLLAGVTIGPVIGGAINVHLYWRWIFYSQLCIYFGSFPFIFLIMKETRGPVILLKRAKNASDQQQANVSELEKQQHHINLVRFLKDNVVRPAYLLVTEPVVFFFTLLTALSYGIVFISSQSVTQVFMALYGWPEHQTAYVQAAIVVGEFLGLLICLYQNYLFERAFRPESRTPRSRLPEVRLYMSIPASFIGLAGGLFWYGWTSYSSLHWILPVIGLTLTGIGSMVVMQAVMMYLTDAYAKYAASASAAACAGENIFAAFLPLAAQSMYTNLGFQWASSVLAFIALALSFAPIVLIFYGETIRRWSPFMSQATYE
ncbi:uncharacterized protein PV07_05268 [Cladophialophora immunda]|uniref:Major facilitator superfamily (MFS) profile domain-containing protein n=1 Tax=Cladophialophora immunda TaxID=569365 RepID=A0A0D2D0Z9_9EURO|nr:uncharacterized protein PV07_05268 [Cladophialophora immunda]KIW29454.1 hypothetical protein PV07_05268 [Cladophialophora immunda]